MMLQQESSTSCLNLNEIDDDLKKLKQQVEQIEYDDAGQNNDDIEQIDDLQQSFWEQQIYALTQGRFENSN